MIFYSPSLHISPEAKPGLKSQVERRERGGRGEGEETRRGSGGRWYRWEHGEIKVNGFVCFFMNLFSRAVMVIIMIFVCVDSNWSHPRYLRNNLSKDNLNKQ